jgi:hypothetical protein
MNKIVLQKYARQKAHICNNADDDENNNNNYYYYNNNKMLGQMAPNLAQQTRMSTDDVE